MDNSDADSVSNSVDASGHQVHVIKIFPLDGKPIAESQLWISVIQVINEVTKRLFLRDGQKHTPISKKEALDLLSGEDKKDLATILKRPASKVDKSPILTINTISKTQVLSNLAKANDVDEQKFEENVALQNHYDLAAGGVHTGDSTKNHDLKNAFFNDAGNSLNTTSNSSIVISSLVQIAQFRSWGAIKVSGTEYFKRQVWLEAAAKGMYVEGYIHTEEDRQALFNRLSISERANIRFEYRPVSQQNPFSTTTAADKDTPENKISNSHKISNQYIENHIDIQSLSKEELEFLLMRVLQNEMNAENSNLGNTNDSLISKNIQNEDEDEL